MTNIRRIKLLLHYVVAVTVAMVVMAKDTELKVTLATAARTAVDMGATIHMVLTTGASTSIGGDTARHHQQEDFRRITLPRVLTRRKTRGTIKADPCLQREHHSLEEDGNETTGNGAETKKLSAARTAKREAATA